MAGIIFTLDDGKENQRKIKDALDKSKKVLVDTKTGKFYEVKDKK